jgi:hypothetical protein
VKEKAMNESILCTVYFDNPGKENTEMALKLAKKRADELGIRNIVVASSSGISGVAASEIFKGFNLIVVTSVAGYNKPNEIRMRPECRKEIETNGGRILTTAHVMGGLGRAIHNKFGAIQIDEVVAHVLRLFSEGTKVACEISCMAVDAGYFRTDEEVVAIAGASGGSDTVLVVSPSNSHRFFEMRIRETVCKPR